MNTRLEQEIQQVEEEFVSKGWPFTALDIGNELKNRGINVRQRQVSPVVRQHFHNSDTYREAGYTRTLIPVKGDTDQAFLYHPVGNDSSSYRGTNQDTVPFDPNKPMFPDEPIRVATIIFGYVGRRPSQ